jgi:hypothetical protein
MGRRTGFDALITTGATIQIDEHCLLPIDETLVNEKLNQWRIGSGGWLDGF